MILWDVASCRLIVSAMKIELTGSYDKLVPKSKATRRHFLGTAIFMFMLYIVVLLLKAGKRFVIGFVLWAAIAQSI